MTTFQESRRTQLVQALQSVDAEQVKPIKPKSEAQLEADRSAAESRFGKAAPRVIAADILEEALKDAQGR